jgi:protein-tyrosine phosphatase
VAKHIPPPYPELYKYHVIEVYDHSEEDLLCRFHESSDYINSFLAKQENILVHCANGVSRSPTVVAAYLMKYHKMTAE